MASNGQDCSARKPAGDTAATILALGKAFPPQLVVQEYLVDGFFKNTQCDDPVLKQKLSRLCKTTTVKTRYVVITDEILKQHPEIATGGRATVQQRLDISQSAVTQMAAEACRVCMQRWGRPPADITHLVYVSSSEARFPSGDLHLARDLGLRPQVRRTMICFAGCSGGVAGLRLAKDIVENNPGSRVLLATAETTVLGFRGPSQLRSYDLVGAALFGDGAGAAVLGAAPLPGVESPLLELHAAAQHFLPETEKVIEGRVTEEGISFTLGRNLPEVVGGHVEEFCRGLLREGGRGAMAFSELFWAVHPGGPAILDRVEKTLGLPEDKLGPSRRVLRDYGNTSSSTIMYVLDYLLQEAAAEEVGGGGWGLILAFGPGITFEGILARRLA